MVKGSLGKKVRSQRKKMGLSIRGLADTAGISSTFLWEIEDGNKYPSATALRRLEKILGIDLVKYFVADKFNVSKTNKTEV